YLMEGLRRSRKNLKKRIVNRFKSDDALRQTIQRVREVNTNAFAVYKPRTYSGRITLFWCTEMSFRPYIDNRLGWDAVAEDGLEVHLVPGTHTGLLDFEPHTIVLAEELKRCLLKAKSANADGPERISTSEGKKSREPLR